MQTRIIFLSIIACLFLLVVFTPFTIHSRAQELTLTTTPANIISSKASIDLPGLTGNPLAIIVATPLGDTHLLNPHPIGAWYYSGKWNIFNTDHAVMVPGLKYKIQYFPAPGPSQFLHVITQQNLGEEGSYVDSPALNNHPNAQFQILQNHAPDNRAAYYLNKFEAKAVYNASAGKWFIANVNGEPLRSGTAYNIVISSGGTVGSNIPTSKIEKKAEVLVGVTLKSSKDFIQNWTDIGGPVVGLMTGGPLGLVGSGVEIGYRLPYVAARATIPVTDHEPCDGQWHGGILYIYIVDSKSKETISPANPRPAASSDGGSSSQEWTITQGGTFTVNGIEWLAKSSAEYKFVHEELSSGKVHCRGGLGGPKGGLVAWSSKKSEVRSGGGNLQGNLAAGITLDEDGYRISLKPLTVNGTVQTTIESSSSGGCPPKKPPTSASNSSPRQFGSNDYIVGTAKYGEDRNILTGSSTKTSTTPSSSSPRAVPGLPTSRTTGSITVTQTLVWNLRRCAK